MHLSHTGTLMRETGTEHILHDKHGAWTRQDLTDNAAKEEEARRRADNVNHGYVKINEHAVRHEESKMTAGIYFVSCSNYQFFAPIMKSFLEIRFPTDFLLLCATRTPPVFFLESDCSSFSLALPQGS